MFKEYQLKLSIGEPTKIYRWCQTVLGNEYKDWIFIDWHNWYFYMTDQGRAIFRIKEESNITMFYLTWYDKII